MDPSPASKLGVHTYHVIWDTWINDLRSIKEENIVAQLWEEETTPIVNDRLLPSKAASLQVRTIHHLSSFVDHLVNTFLLVTQFTWFFLFNLQWRCAISSTDQIPTSLGCVSTPSTLSAVWLILINSKLSTTTTSTTYASTPITTVTTISSTVIPHNQLQCLVIFSLFSDIYGILEW